MNTNEFHRAIAERVGLPLTDARKVADAAFDVIKENLAAGEDVAVAGFGKFKVKENAARTARNPATGATVKVPAKKVAKFKPALQLAESLN